MQIFLSKQCESLTGSLGSGYGYAVQKRKSGYYAVRNSKGEVPPDGHLRFILKCTELARMKLHIVDIRVPHKELRAALDEAGRQDVRIMNDEYNAYSIKVLDERWGLSEGLEL